MSDDDRIRVLVVEDDDDVAALHLRLLSAMPRFEVVGRAATLRACVRALADSAPDLVLLDVHLPDGSGLDLLRRLRGASADTFDVIAVTAAKDLASVERSMRLGVADYLVKPFAPADFRRRLDAYARSVRRRRGLPEPELSQADIDDLRTASSTAPTSLPKGLSAGTLERVAAELRDGGPRSSSELGTALGVSRVSARRYLEHLVREGRADAEPQYGEVGRPRLVYGWIEAPGR